jgi:hypothetical protein
MPLSKLDQVHLKRANLLLPGISDGNDHLSFTSFKRGRDPATSIVLPYQASAATGAPVANRVLHPHDLRRFFPDSRSCSEVIPNQGHNPEFPLQNEPETNPTGRVPPALPIRRAIPSTRLRLMRL